MRWRATSILVVLAVCLLISPCDGFSVLPSSSSSSAYRQGRPPLCLQQQDNEDEDKKNDDDSWLFRELQARQDQLQQEQEDTVQRWRDPSHCETSVVAVLPDWVRRIDVDYPLCACGSANTGVHIVHLETGAVLASSETTANDDDDDDDDSTSIDDDDDEPTSIDNKDDDKDDEILRRTILRQMFGNYDGGGTLAIAMRGTLVCEAPRTGGVRILRFIDTPTNDDDETQYRLVSQGNLPAMGRTKTIVTALQLDDEYLWVGTADGSVQAYPHNERLRKDGDDDKERASSEDDGLPLALQKRPEKEWKFGSAVLSLTLHETPLFACAVVATASGAVHVVSLDEDEEQDMISFSPPFDSSERSSSSIHCRCATLVPYRAKKKSKTGGGEKSSLLRYAVVCGGSDGSLYVQPLASDDDEGIDWERPLVGTRQRSLRPFHFGSVQCLISPSRGIVVSAGQDGTMRFWNIEEDDEEEEEEESEKSSPRGLLPNSRTCLFQLVGYKVWIGSLWTDGKRLLISDGADNTVMQNDFGASSTSR